MNATNQKGQTDVVSSQVATIVEKYRHSPHMFLRMLLEIQQVLPGNAITENVADLVSEVVGIPQAKLYGLTSFYSMLSDTKRGQTIIRMCMSAPCQVRGAMQVAQGLLDELNLAAEQQTTADGAFTFEYCECLGVCDKSPAALIDEKVHPNLDAVSVTDFMLDLPSEPPVAQQPEPVLLKNVGLINPIDAKAYLEAGGYLALKKVLDTSGAEIISMIEASGLRGRGGAGFPTGLKWKTTYDAPANQKYVVCNADEGEPGTNKDRLLLAGDPNLIFEGMAIAGKAVGASKGIIYLRSEYQCLLPTLETAVENAVAQGCLGKSIFGSDFDFDIEVCTGAGAYICGEESALLNSIEGKRGEPRLRPPYPASVGLYGKPTVINNVETLANVPLIMANTADWYRGLGTKTCPGTKLYTVSGNVKRRGVYELPMGVNLKDLIYEVCGGIEGDRKLLAVQTGGSSGPILNASQIDINLDVEQAAAAGGSLGTGSILVIDEEQDLINVLKEIARFFRDESCGSCVPCREGTKRQYDLVAKLAEHKGTPDDLQTIADLATTMSSASRCGLGTVASVAMSSAMTNFPDLFATLVAKEVLDHA